MFRNIIAVLVLLSAQIVYANSLKKSDVKHIIVVYFENRSFDNIFRGFAGADTSDKPHKPYSKQVDENGTVYKYLPMGKEAIAQGVPENLPNEPFLIDSYIPQSKNEPDLVHRFYQNKDQINGGKNDRFVAVSDAKGFAMGYHDMKESSTWKYAKEYTLCDNFFAAAFGGSFLNHHWLIAARSPTFFDADRQKISTYELDNNDSVVKDGVLTHDGYAVNTIQPFSMPYKPKVTDSKKRLPAQTHDTIGDRLSAKNISWAWYSGGYDKAMSGSEEENYQYHHNPFAYFAKYDIGIKGREHLRDESEFFKALSEGSLPKVSFIKPIASENQHPGYASLKDGDDKLDKIVKAVKANKKIWKKTVIIVTYDENGGFWDHVAPPKIDRWGPGTRVPTLIISPMAKRGYVDHSVYDTTSILKLIENRYNLAPLSDRDKNAKSLLRLK